MKFVQLAAAAVCAATIAAAGALPVLAQQTPAAPAQKAAQATEAPLRKFIADMAKGTPDYSTMGQALADAVRGSMPGSSTRISELGALKTLVYTETGPGGMDVYVATFEKGALEFRIVLSADGKIAGAFMRPHS